MRVTKRSLYYWILHRHYGLQFLMLLVIIISLFFRIVPLEMQKRIVNQAIELKDYQLLFIYCGIYFVAVLLTGISKYAINYLQVLIGQKILVEIRTRLYHHILQLPLQFYRTMQPGTVILAMTTKLNLCPRNLCHIPMFAYWVEGRDAEPVKTITITMQEKL